MCFIGKITSCTKPNSVVVHHPTSRIYWKRDIPGDNYNREDIYDWRQSEYLIVDQPTYQRYRIKVIAVNEKGESNVAAREVIGYSGEDKPLEKPENFTLLQITASTSAVMSWQPVSLESVRGHFKGYKIQTWTEADGEENLREIHVTGDSNRALVTKFTPNAVNFVRILAYNTRYNGPASDVLSFTTPEGVPSTVQSLDAYALGSSAFHLVWKKPAHPNGELTGYKIYYEEVRGTELGTKMEREPHIHDPEVLSNKLAGLKSNTKYRIHVTATTRAGEGEE